MEVFSGVGSEGQDEGSIDLRCTAVHTDSPAHEANQQPPSKPKAQWNRRHKDARSETQNKRRGDNTEHTRTHYKRGKIEQSGAQ